MGPNHQPDNSLCSLMEHQLRSQQACPRLLHADGGSRNGEVRDHSQHCVPRRDADRLYQP